MLSLFRVWKSRTNRQRISYYHEVCRPLTPDPGIHKASGNKKPESAIERNPGRCNDNQMKVSPPRENTGLSLACEFNNFKLKTYASWIFNTRYWIFIKTCIIFHLNRWSKCEVRLGNMIFVNYFILSCVDRTECFV